MPTPVFFTVDTELAWRHHRAGLPLEGIYQRSVEPAGVGTSYQLAQLKRFGLKGTFFIDPMPALVFGLDPVRRMVDAVLDAGQEAQLHIHPNWAGARVDDAGASHGRFELIDYNTTEQRDLIAGARDLLVAAGAPAPVAFRSGSYSANDDTLAVLTALGILYDSSHNGAEHPWPSAIGLPREMVGPAVRNGVVELPVTLIEDRVGSLRPFQLCAMSAGEMRAALDHADAQDHGAVTIVSHSFELANRAGTRANPIHLRRFDALCRMLADRAETMPTTHFADRPRLALARNRRLLAPDLLRTSWRQAEQLWSNYVSERAA